MLKGKGVYVSVAASLGTMAAIYNYQLFTIVSIFIYLIWLSLKKDNNVKLLLTCILSISLFSFLYTWVDENNISLLTGKETNFTGVIESTPVIDGNRISFIMKLPSNEKLKLSYKIKTEEEKSLLQPLQPGISCTVDGTLTTPEAARNFDGFDYQKYLYYKQIHWILTPNDLDPSQCTSSSSFKFLLKKWRGSELTFIKDHFPKNTVGIAQALIFGERNEIDSAISERFLEFGIIHLLAISGLHVGLVVAFIFYFLIRIGLSRERSFLLLFVLLPFYIILAGGAPSVIRAGLVTMVLLLSIQFKAKILPLDALSIIFLFMLFVNPYYINEIGFQLSFLVSFSLVLSAPCIIRKYESRPLQMLSVTSIAQLSSLPVILTYNYEISLLSLPLNILFVPLMSFIILPLSFISYVSFHLFQPLGTVFSSILSVILQYSFAFLEWAEHFSFFTLTFGKPERWLIVIYYVVIVYFFMSWENNQSLGNIRKSIFLILLTLFYHWFSPYLSNEGQITMIDVGQGDSFLIELPYRKAVYLIDTGGTVPYPEEDWEKRKKKFEVGEDILVPLLKAKGIRTINKLILSHNDYDHVGATEGLLDHIKVDEVLIGASKSIDENDKKFYETIHKKDIPIQKVKTGDYWDEDEFRFIVLGPNGDEENKNNASIVLYTYISGKYWLFTGDLEKEGEQRILKQFPNIKIDVLKVGHHGSKTSTSSSFIKQIKPNFALISVGKNNRYGHPNSEVISLLQDSNAFILRTDQHGSVRFKFIRNQGTFEWKLPYDKNSKGY